MVLDFQRGSFMHCASAVGLDSSLFPAQGTSVLSTLGGSSVSESAGYRLPALELSTKSITSRCGGKLSQSMGGYETLVESTIMGFTYGKSLNMELAQVSLMSNYSRGQHDLIFRLPTEWYFEFAGYDVTVVYSQELLNFRNKHSMLNALTDASFLHDHSNKFYKPSHPATAVRNAPQGLWEAGGYLIYSPIEQIKWAGEGIDGNTVQGHVLVSPKVGRLYLAEAFRSENACRMNLFRFMAAGATQTIRTSKSLQETSLIDDGDGGGVIVGGSVLANGTYIPP